MCGVNGGVVDPPTIPITRLMCHLMCHYGKNYHILLIKNLIKRSTPRKRTPSEYVGKNPENCPGVCGETPVDTQVVGNDTWHHQKFLWKSWVSSVDSKSKIGDNSPSIRSWETFLGSISTLEDHTRAMRPKLVRFEPSRPLFDTIFVTEVPVTDQKSVFARGSWTRDIRRRRFFVTGFWLWPPKMT